MNSPAVRMLVMLAMGFATLDLSAATVFIHDATVYTMATPPLLQGADILVRDGHIAAIGRGLKAPANATVVEGSKRPVTPAFFAGITALGLEEISLEQSTADQALHFDKMRPEFDVSVAYNPFSAAIPVTRIEGYGWTLLSASRSGSIIGGLGRAVSLDGAYDSFLSAPVLFVGLGSQTSELSGNSRAAQFMLLNQAMEESHSAMAWSPDALLTAEGRRVLAGYTGGNVVVFDVDRASDILQELAFSAHNTLTPVIMGGAEAWMVAEPLAEAGVPVVLDPLVNLPGSFDQLGARLDNAAILHSAGVTIA
ncbi:MAG: amidohydrolase family protein, partial [Lysobacterales bacterium]